MLRARARISLVALRQGCIAFGSLFMWTNLCPHQRGIKRELPGQALEDVINSRSGNESEYICMDCGKLFRKGKKADCPKCKSTQVVERMEVRGLLCPKCKQGVFIEK